MRGKKQGSAVHVLIEITLIEVQLWKEMIKNSQLQELVRLCQSFGIMSVRFPREREF